MPKKGRRSTRKTLVDSGEESAPDLDEGVQGTATLGKQGQSNSCKIVTQSRANIGNFKFQPYVEETEQWAYYVNRFEVELARLELTGSVDDHTRSILFLTAVGPSSFKILVDHFRPRDVKEVPYNELRTVLWRVYEKSTCIFAERRAFAMRNRYDGEAVAKFVNGLRKLAGTCEFGSSLEERLRDQLVIGINSPKWQEELIRLHQTNEATFQEVETSTLALEKAQAQQLLLAEFSNADSNKINMAKSGPSMKPTFTKFQQIKKGEEHCKKCGFEKHAYNSQCPASGQKCMKCDKIGHYARMCLFSKRTSHQQTRQISRTNEMVDNANEIASDDDQFLNNVKGAGNKIMLKVKLNNVEIDMLYDLGAAQSVINRQIWAELGRPRLTPCTSLVAYTGVEIETLGKIKVHVHSFGKTRVLNAVVVKKHDVPLFGLDWALKFEVPMPEGARICTIQSKESVTSGVGEAVKIILDKFPNIFSEGLGTMKGHRARIHLEEDAKPRAFRARSVPFALKEKVDHEIDRLVAEGIVEAVDPNVTPVEWASPIVVCVKATGAVRICGDFKVTINKYINANHYPLPKFEDLVIKLSGGTHFSVIDLKDAYLQMEVDEESRKFLIIATHRGFFRYRRLPFGVCFAPGLFQKTIEDILSGIKNVACLLDDIIITSTTREGHLKTLEEVLARLDRAGIKTQIAKCKWFQESVKYLGHRIDKEGIHPLEDHLEALRQMPPPKNLQELKAFLGTVNYYGRFIKDLQPMCSSLHNLTRKGVRWEWSDECRKTFEKLRMKLSSESTLVHYSTELPVVITANASSTGLGAVLFHRMEDGRERPVMYASRILSKPERNYSSIDREALGIIFAVQKFYQYLQGRKFILKTDHKPLKYILSEDKEVPKMAANRLLRWAIILRSFDYSIEYISGKENTVADTLSRLPLDKDCESSEYEKMGRPGSAQLLHLHLRDAPVTAMELRKYVSSDEQLQKSVRYLNSGWPQKKDLEKKLLPYFEKREELSYEEGILLWNGRIVVPEKLKNTFLNMVHLGHPGSRAMRSIARIHIWWPGIDREIENYIGNCLRCQGSRPAPEEAPIYSWNIPTKPWFRLHVDFAGPFHGIMWLLIVDASTKWIEVIPMSSTTSQTTIAALKDVFNRFGLPEVIVSDNGPQFTSKEFHDYCKGMSISHVKTTPYHPRTNGLAVRTFKERLRLEKGTRAEILEKVGQFLFSYRSTPHSTTGRSPAELLLGRQLRKKFDLLKPSVDRNQDRALLHQQLNHDKGKKLREFVEGEEVWVKLPAAKDWTLGRVSKRSGPVSYEVEVDDRKFRKHVDQMRKKT